MLRVCILICFLFCSREIYARAGKKSIEQCQSYRNINTGFVLAKRALNRIDVVGGQRTSAIEFPHMVALGYGDQNNRKWNCGGSLISKNFVLTAAHCLVSRNYGEVKIVRLGTTNLENPKLTYEDREISQTIRHPEFKSSRKYNDIALLRLKTDVNFNGKIKPACLQTSTDFDSSTLTATGWGSESNGGPSSPHLLKVSLVPYNISTCNGFYNNQKKDLPDGVQPKSMVCAGGKTGESKDTCSGDSGGPLQIFNQQYYIIGVTSFGFTCGTPNVPAIYTRVSNYIEWIEKNVWP